MPSLSSCLFKLPTPGYLTQISGVSRQDIISHYKLTTALAGITAIEAMGGPKIPWQKGRSDYESEQLAGDHRGNVGDRSVAVSI